MNIEQELEQWLSTHIPDTRKQKARDLTAVLIYYGFGDLAWPTLEQIGQQLSIGTRERVRQVINQTFKDHATIDQLPRLRAALHTISKVEIAPLPQLRQDLMDAGYISGNIHIRGLLNLANDLGVLENYDLYDNKLNTLVRAEAEFDEKTFIAAQLTVQELKAGLRKARTLPGLLGLARFEYVRSLLGDSVLADRIIGLIRLSSDAEYVEHKGQEWYIFEDRDNSLLNSCEKIFFVASECSVSVLSSTLHNSLRRRSHRFEYPSRDVIEKWIHQSRWFELSQGVATFLGQPRELTGIEKEVVSYLESTDNSNYSDLKDHLLTLGFGKALIDKAVTTSPLVHVDKSGKRTNYTYTLISRASSKAPRTEEIEERYQHFGNRLKRLAAANGTDTPGEVLLRREQSILREWLFAGDKTSRCAICQNQYAVGALVAAHKKGRSMCSESERTDPWVVFPLCHFGCDYLYEVGALVIKGGKVVCTTDAASETNEARVALALDGNVLDPQWLKGKAAYFERDQVIAGDAGP